MGSTKWRHGYNVGPYIYCDDIPAETVDLHGCCVACGGELPYLPYGDPANAIKSGTHGRWCAGCYGLAHDDCMKRKWVDRRGQPWHMMICPDCYHDD